MFQQVQEFIGNTDGDPGNERGEDFRPVDGSRVPWNLKVKKVSKAYRHRRQRTRPSCISFELPTTQTPFAGLAKASVGPGFG